MKRYQYLVAYSFQGGVGRTFVTCSQPIDSDDRVESVERSIRASNGIETVAMMSFQLLRSYDEGAGDCAAAQKDPRQAFGEHHLGKPFAAPVPTIKLGLYGRAFDTPQTRRAYTYQHQPDNLDAGKLGRAVLRAASGGDSIDYGLSLLKHLQAEGFGVFELGDQQEGGAA